MYNFTFPSQLTTTEMITKSDCLTLHDALLTQLTYLKIVIGILSLGLLLFMLAELKRKKRSKKK